MNITRPNTGVVSDAVAAILRNLTPAERLERAFRLIDRVRETLSNAVKNEHPEWPERQVRREVARRFSHLSDEDVPPSLRYYQGD